MLPQTSSTSSGSQDESKYLFILLCILNIIYLVLQHILTSPNPPKQPSTIAQNAAQARLRTVCITNKSIQVKLLFIDESKYS
jgi:hypothetical protein